VPPSASPSPRAHDRSRESDSEGSGDPGLRTVLLVEDNSTDVFVIREVIDRCELDLNLRVATDGQDAVHYFQDLARAEKPACPALVLLDLNIPKVAGVEVLRHLRGATPCSRTPVIVVTSSRAEADRLAVERLGVEAYFQKPTSLAAYMQLGHLIKQLLDLGSRQT
jgi:CheY-like chemotaxis protein